MALPKFLKRLKPTFGRAQTDSDAKKISPCEFYRSLLYHNGTPHFQNVCAMDETIGQCNNELLIENGKYICEKRPDVEIFGQIRDLKHSRPTRRAW